MNPIFRIKKFEELNLGSYLRNGREKLGFSLDCVAEKISVSRRHLKALEENDFSRLPPEIYVKGFIDQYCNLVELDKNEALHLYEKNKQVPKKDLPVHSLIAYAWLGRIFSYRNFAILAAILFLAASIFYISKAIYPMYAKPAFSLHSPNSCPFQTYEEKFSLKGLIQPESKIWVNDEEVLVDKEGDFDCPLLLKKGDNSVRFKVVNKFGKERSEECLIRKN